MPPRKNRKPKQKNLPIKGLNTKLATAADRYLNARDALKESRDELKELEANLVRELKAHARTAVVHRGQTLAIKHTEEKEGISVRE